MKSSPPPDAITSSGVVRSLLPPSLLALGLALVTVALYWPAMEHDFVDFDDHLYVLENPRVTSGFNLENVWWAFRSGDAANWHPLTWLSHMLDCELYGLKPWGHHLTSVMLHALNAALVFILVRLLTGKVWRSLFVAALFAVHPLRVESVAWVAERKDVLSGSFGFIALIFYSRYAQQARGGKSSASGSWFPAYWLSLLFLALGLMSKPMLVTWPFVMLLLDYWPLRRFENSMVLRLLTEKIPFVALAVASSIVTFIVQLKGGAVETIQNLSLEARICNAVISYCRYLAKIFWPTDMVFFYPYPKEWPLLQVLLAAGVIMGISALCFVQRRRWPFLLMGWLWFLGMLVPVIGLIQVGSQSMADRYTYAVGVGLSISLVWTVRESARGSRFHPAGWAAVGSAVAAICMVLTRQQLSYWQDSETLFRHALVATKGNDLAYLNLGNVLSEKGQLDEAIHQFQEAIRLNPACADAHNNLGNAFRKQGRIEEATHQYQVALEVSQDSPDIHNNLGIVLNDADRTDEAIGHFRKALRLKPDYAEAQNNLGIALDKAGQLDNAIRHFQQAVRLKPSYAEAHNNLGIALFKKGEPGSAVFQYKEALRLKPGFAEAHSNLGTAYYEQGHMDTAIIQYQEALRFKPNDALTHCNLGNAFYQEGRTEEAIRQYEEALRLRPDYVEARENLEITLASKGGASKPPAPAATP